MPGKISMGPIGFFGLAFGLIATMGGAYWVGQHQKPKVDPIVAYTKEFEAYKDSVVKPALVVADSLKIAAEKATKLAEQTTKVAENQTTKINKLTATINVLRAKNKSLSDSVLTDNTLPSVCDQCKRAVQKLTMEIDTLHQFVQVATVRDSLRVRAIFELHDATEAFKARGDSLTRVIQNFPKPPKPNKFLGITLPKIPSQYVALGGAVVGIMLIKR